MGVAYNDQLPTEKPHSWHFSISLYKLVYHHIYQLVHVSVNTAHTSCSQPLFSDTYLTHLHNS